MSDKEIIGGVTESPVHSAQPNDQAVALGEAFDAGVGVFEQQLVQLSDQQYVRLLTLLDEYPTHYERSKKIPETPRILS